MAASKKKRYSSRDGICFVILPHVVLDSIAFIRLSGPAVRLLLDIARQLNGKNNGRLVACSKYMAPRGWKSNDTLLRARRELESSGLIMETRKGARPNRATWYAITWDSLDWVPEMDIKREQFQRSAYAKHTPLPPVPKTSALYRQTV